MKSIFYNHSSYQDLKQFTDKSIHTAITNICESFDIEMKLTRSKMLIKPLHKIHSSPEMSREHTIQITIQLSEDLNGVFILSLPQTFTSEIFQNLDYFECKDSDSAKHLCLSLLKETGNIICCTFVNSFSQMYHLKIDISVPSIMTTRISSLLFYHTNEQKNKYFYIQENLITFQKKDFCSHILFIPNTIIKN